MKQESRMMNKMFFGVLSLAVLFVAMAPAASADEIKPGTIVTDAVCRALVNKLDGYEGRVKKEKSSLDSREKKEISGIKQLHLERKEVKLPPVDMKSIFGGKQFRALEARASTTEEKQAISDFKTAVTRAATTRQTALEAAFNEFHIQMLNVVADYDNSITAAVTARTNSISAAVAKAKADCISGVTPNLIRSQFNASLREGEETFKNNQQRIANAQAQENLLIASRKAKYDAAVAEFKAAVSVATEQLRTVFMH